MKIVFQMLLATFCYLNVLPAQGQIRNNLKWGLSGSISNTNFNYIKPFSRNSITGFKGGIFTTQRISSRYELLLTLNVSRYGSRIYASTRIIVPQANYDSTFYTIDKYLFTYVNLNPQLQYFTRVSGRVKPFIGFGFLAGYLLKATAYNYTGKGVLFHKNNDRLGYYKFNFGVNVDIGVKIHIAKRLFYLSGSYEPGLTNNGKAWAYNTSISGFRTHALSINAAYLFSN
jgi:hypothetical protein